MFSNRLIPPCVLDTTFKGRPRNWTKVRAGNIYPNLAISRNFQRSETSRIISLWKTGGFILYRRDWHVRCKWGAFSICVKLSRSNFFPWSHKCIPSNEPCTCMTYSELMRCSVGEGSRKALNSAGGDGAWKRNASHTRSSLRRDDMQTSRFNGNRQNLPRCF